MCLSSASNVLDAGWGRLRNALGEVLSPTRCVCCEQPGSLLCERCSREIAWIDPADACSRCGAPFGRMLCTECNGVQVDLDHCLAAAVFDGPPAQMVRAYKDAGELRLAHLLSSMLCQAFLRAERSDSERYGHLASSVDALTFVPATAEAFRRRGFDHMETICGDVSARLGIPVLDALVKHGRSDQRKAGRRERALLSHGVYEVVAPVTGLNLLVLDDVITTGATLNAVARVLKRSGAARVDGLAVARVWG